MFGFGKKKIVPQPEVILAPKKVLKFKKQEFDIGITVVELYFDNGQFFKVSVYGHIDQLTTGGIINSPFEKHREAFVGEVQVIDSKKNAQTYISSISRDEQVYSNDTREPTEVLVGTVRSAKIKTTKSFIALFNVGYMVDENHPWI